MIDVMLTHADVRDWAAREFGWQVFNGRIADLGYAYSVSTHPDAYHAGDQSAMTWGNGPLIVVKRTGAGWGFGSNPMFLPLYEARDEREFYATLARLMPRRDLNQPDYAVPLDPGLAAPPDPGLTEAALRDWLAFRYPFFGILDTRISDSGYAYRVNIQPDAVLLGDNSAFLAGIGPLTVIKRTGAVWHFGSNPTFLPLYEAVDENDFYRLLRELSPNQDPAQPAEVVPIR